MNYNGPFRAPVQGPELNYSEARWPYDPTQAGQVPGRRPAPSTYPPAPTAWGGAPFGISSSQVRLPSGSASFGTVQSFAGARSSLAPSFTLLFAGMIVGVIVGLVALFPNVLARRAAASGAAAAARPRAAAVVLPATAAVAPAVAPPPASEPSPSATAANAPKASAIDEDETLVTVLPVAEGERVSVDGRVVTTAEPTKMKCGKHTVRVGSGTKRRVSFPCGGALTLN